MTQTQNILITRELTDEQQDLAESLGLNVVSVPALSIEFRNDWYSVQSSIDSLQKLVFAFTSQNGVKGFEHYIAAGGTFPENTSVYAVGEKTAEALHKIGFHNVITPKKRDGVGLAHQIIDDFLKTPELKKATVLHFCGDRRRDELRYYLTESKIQIKDIVVYKTRLNNMRIPDLSFDALLFYSPSSVQAFRQSGGFSTTDLPELFAIGTTTAEELSLESGKHVHISPEPDTEVLLEFVAQVFGKSGDNLAEKCPPSKGVMGDDRNLYYNKNLKNLAQNLRNDSTKAEIRLWSELLHCKQSGHTFLRKRPVLNYIADFLNKDLKLIIELAGYSHEFEQPWKKDKDKQKELEDTGFKILRFSDEEVMNDLRNVESEIMYWIEKLESYKGDDISPPKTSGVSGG